jgi:hypothetical protein
MHYKQNLEHEVGMIAHACGVNEARELRRFHARMVLDNGKSIALDQLYPEVKPPLKV